MKPSYLVKAVFLLFVFLNLTRHAFSQDTSSKKNGLNVSGSASVTNNGISIIPSFTLGKPAAVFDLNVGNRLRFEPEFKFSLVGKPWAFIFRWRYDLVNTNQFYVRLGLNHGVSFKNQPELSNGVTNNVIEAGRFLGGELKADYFVAKHISIGIFSLQGHGFDKRFPASTTFIAFNSDIADVTIFNDFYFEFKPQIYYLKVDRNDGFYAAEELDLGNRKFPITVESVVNKIIHTNIAGSKNVLWNVSLKYSFAF